MKIKLQFIDWSILATIASTTLYIVFRNLGREIGSFAFLWAPITLLSIFYKHSSTFSKGPMRILLLYGLIMVGILQFALWKNMTEWNKVRISYEFYFLVVMTTILVYYWSRGEFMKLAFLSKLAFIFIVITLITTNIALFLDPHIVRESAATGLFSDNQKAIFKFTGAMEYSYVQSVICLIPILIYHIKSNRSMVFPPRVLVAILILIIITEIRSLVLANLIITLIITIISFIGSKKRSITFVTFSLAALLLLSTSNTFFANISSNMSNYFEPNSLMRTKLSDFARFIENPEFDNSTEAGSRAERYPLLYKALIASPITGDASYVSGLKLSGGAHLYWMNKLALWGIPGFLFFIYVLYKIFKKISSLFDSGYRFFYYLSLLTLVFLGLSKVVGGREPWLMLIVVIPGLYFLPLLETDIKNRRLS
jgi:hypothetical protein